MNDQLDTLIADIKADSELSAEALNALHGATSTHPWCRGKTFIERKSEVLMAIAGRRVNRVAAHRVERLA